MEHKELLLIDQDLHFQRVLDSLYDEVKNMITEKVNEKNMLKVAVLLMQLAEKETHLSGKGKKQVVILLLEKLVDDTLDRDEAVHVKFLISAIVPSVIDTVISIDKKEIEIKIKDISKKFLCC